MLDTGPFFSNCQNQTNVFRQMSLKEAANIWYPATCTIQLGNGPFIVAIATTTGLQVYCAERGTSASKLLGDLFYKKKFMLKYKGNKDQQHVQMNKANNPDWKDIDKMLHKSCNKHFHILVIGDMKDKQPKVVASVSFITKTDGLVVSWLAVSDDTYNDSEFGGQPDGLPFRARALGSFLVSRLLDFQKMNNSACLLLTQVNANIPDAANFWFKRLLFQRWDKAKTLPPWVRTHLIADNGLTMIHATYCSLNAIWPAVMSNELTLPMLMQASLDAIFQGVKLTSK
jgi:hypothetical protein